MPSLFNRTLVQACALFFTGAFVSPVADGQTPKASTDSIPPDCGKTQFLGESNGCACFVCNSESKTATRKVVCSNDPTVKSALFKNAQ